jgi:hypothetical protein
VAAGIPAGLTPAEGRKFGLQVGAAFAVLGALSRWRGHDTAPLVLWALGGLLIAGGLFFPGRLGPVYRAWMGLAVVLSKVTTPLFLGIVYFGVIAPMGVVMRLLGRNPLVHRPERDSYWVAHTPSDSMTRQF